MMICPAQVFDMPGIMAVERAAFIPQIQESEKVFSQRLQCFPQGFLVLMDTVLEKKKPVNTVAGYLCAEQWNSVPVQAESYALGHDITRCHQNSGKVLYVSSYGILPAYRGKGTGRCFFEQALRSLTGKLSSVETVALLVNTEWKGALHIYESLGFKEIARLEKFFPSLHEMGGSDGLVMTCKAADLQFSLPEMEVWS